MTKDDVADALDEIGLLLDLQGENPFKTNAYHNGARALRQATEELPALIAAGRLGEIRGIGDALQEKITTLVTTGRLPYLERLREAVPPGLLELRGLPGLGAKKVRALHAALGVDSLAKLKAACEAGQVAGLKGFGEKTQQRLLEGIAFLGTVGTRVRIDQAYPVGLALLEQVRGFPGVVRAELCGSLRRRRETVKDVDIVAGSADPGPVLEAFATQPGVLQVAGRGDTKASVVLGTHVGGDKVVLNADLRVVADDQFPFALHYFTGSREHNIRMRRRAAERGWVLSEYGLGTDAHRVPAADEAGVFAALGLDYIEPELREDAGEIEAAAAHALPRLVAAGDVRGVFHNHTTYSDGGASLEEMALAAKRLGFEYFGVGDHSQSLTVARGMSAAAVRRQWAEIDALNARLPGIRILKGVESDILADGSLDYDDDVLAGLEYVVGSVHSHFQMTEAEMTARVCRALAHPRLTMLGHSTGRLLLKREGYKLDLDAVLRAAAEHGKMIEINAQPSRLDLDWVHVRKAKALGIPIVINPDAHSPGELSLFAFGVDVARRGWLTRDDVFNTRSLADVLAELARRKALADRGL